MFRITTSVLTARKLLYRRVRPDIQLAAITRTPPTYKYANPQERDPCSPPPPLPPPKPKEDALLWGTLTLLALTGAFAVYAKSNPELRDWLTLNAPWLDDFIAVLHQENMTYGEFAEKCVVDTKKAIANFFKEEPPLCDSEGNPIPRQVQDNPECPPPKPIEGDYVIVNLSDLDRDSDEEADCIRVAPPILTKDICEIETCLKDLGEAALCNYNTARDACILYNQQVEETMMNFTVKKLKELHHAAEERRALVEEHVGNAVCATAKLDELTRYFECGVQAPKDAVKNTKDLLKEYCDKVKTIRMQWQWENDRSLVMDTQWQLVEELVDKYTDENVKMTKELDYMSKKPALWGDADLLLHHSLRYVVQLKEELADALSGMTERINRGLESSVATSCDGKVLDEKALKDREANIQALYKKKLAEIDSELKKRADDKKAENAKEATNAMKKLNEQQQNTLALRLEQKTVEATKKLSKLVATQVEVERKLMAKQKAAMVRKLKIVEDKLEARLRAEREARRSQELWTAGYSLLRATKLGDPVVRVDKELKAIEKASGGGDKLVLSVLKAIPDSVRKKGVVPESVIREKYHVMEDVALKVALVEQEGAPLPVYILSFIQSLFLFMKVSGIPQKEFDKPPKEPSKELDTFDLLQRARFWIERGDIAGALKYVNALEGASRAAASAWYDAARSHLETRQAAEAVLAHAAALGLQYV